MDFVESGFGNTKMSNQMVVNVKALVRPVSLPLLLDEVENLRSESPEPYRLTTTREDNAINIYDGDNTTEEDSLIPSAECLICHEESNIKNLPCACSGTLKYAHRKCVQRWCNEKGDTLCEICHQAMQTPFQSYLQEMLALVERERLEREAL